MADEQLSQEDIDSLMGGDISTQPGGMDLDNSNQEDKEKKKEKKRKKTPDRQKTLSIESDNMELLLDVQMTLSVELGRSKRSVKEVLSYGEGSIVELEKVNGEPVDILINGRMIGKGEVVVIDETYGVKVTELLDPYESLRGIAV